ncbi:Uncharacterized conserved protein PhnB, glyoxalase superfamily [Sphingobacterium wenxiniae]|uniref:Uncharacterized conserved protein PhnB, glyoxalase superfamily n=2 Tax=Sphingobacterium wenxiniae TaxID=683125 RepID=A0A1I6VR19_9SPHI|nr:Uncharacterized conserved protein PhnB, glyoxalase superfamily [Sphingobacterium wenxiniae]
MTTSKYVGAVFITFSGNCRKALTYYQTCFGGTIAFDTLETEIQGYTEKPVVIGSLVSDSIIIHGSDLIHNEGRIRGNYLSVFLQCNTIGERQALIEKLEFGKTHRVIIDDVCQKLIEVIDSFDVRWVIAI